MKDKKDVKSGQLTMSRVPYKQNVAEALRKQVMLPGGDSLILRPGRGKVENLNRNDLVNAVYFEDIKDTLKQAMVRNIDEEMV